MLEKHLYYLVCPQSGNPLILEPLKKENGRVKSGVLHEKKNGYKYPIINFIPRFVSSDNYADNFGLEWNVHSRTQYDLASGHLLSEKRFFDETKWPDNLCGDIILEAGSGSGRFTEIVAKTGAMVLSFDYSQAVDANYKSNGHLNNVLIIQADIFQVPFRKNFFDRVFCFGVLQHTPDPQLAFYCLVDILKAGGKIAADIYIKNLGRYWLQTKYWVRPFTRKMEPKKLYGFVQSYVNLMWPLAKLIRKIPRIGPTINWKLLIADYSRQLPKANDATLKEWAYLDTFDMLSPRYDFPATVSTFRSWLVSKQLENVDVSRGYNGVEGRGSKPW